MSIPVKSRRSWSTHKLCPFQYNAVEAGVHTSYVHSSIKYALQFSVHAGRYEIVTCTRNKVRGIRGGKVGQLVVTPEVVAKQINNMKENKSPGVDLQFFLDGIAPKILKETVEQMCTPLAHVFNMYPQERIVPLEWKEANSIPLLKKGSRNKS